MKNMTKKILWEAKVSRKDFLAKNTLPEYPGVYFFLDDQEKILYIGKATSLRDRVKSYFVLDMMETRGPKIELMMNSLEFIGYHKSDSVLEALLLESELIKKIQPPYNTSSKDDKSYNEIVITKENYPRVLIVRSRDRAQGKFILPIQHVFGPFPDGGGLREAMKIVRRLFPFRDKCTPFDELSEKAKLKARPCFSAQIGLCPGVCVGRVTKIEYAKTLRHIRLFFQGKKGTILSDLEKSMLKASSEQRFEDAQEIKKVLFGLRHIEDMALVKNDLTEGERHRIEAYDVAHIQGESAVGVMTVVQNSRTQVSEYRQFKLRVKHNGNDLTALEEILRRRFAHPEWPYPELVVVDGSDVHIRVAEKVLSELEITIPVVSVVKDERHRPREVLGTEALALRFKKEAFLANAEAHRFALTFHRKRRAKNFLPKELTKSSDRSKPKKSL
jgi:excinuclease ABC subunit C